MKNNTEFCYKNYAMAFCEYFMIYEESKAEKNQISKLKQFIFEILKGCVLQSPNIESEKKEYFCPGFKKLQIRNSTKLCAGLEKRFT